MELVFRINKLLWNTDVLQHFVAHIKTPIPKYLTNTSLDPNNDASSVTPPTPTLERNPLLKFVRAPYPSYENGDDSTVNEDVEVATGKER